MSEKHQSNPMQCVGKVAFDTQPLAAKVAQRRRRSGGDKRRQAPYKCAICKKWHLGNHQR